MVFRWETRIQIVPIECENGTSCKIEYLLILAIKNYDYVNSGIAYIIATNHSWPHQHSYILIYIPGTFPMHSMIL